MGANESTEEKRDTAKELGEQDSQVSSQVEHPPKFDGEQSWSVEEPELSLENAALRTMNHLGSCSSDFGS
jgi:hypothetical protein